MFLKINNLKKEEVNMVRRDNNPDDIYEGFDGMKEKIKKGKFKKPKNDINDICSEEFLKNNPNYVPGKDDISME
jgi:hypothetical protein